MQVDFSLWFLLILIASLINQLSELRFRLLVADLLKDCRLYMKTYSIGLISIPVANI